MNTSNIGATSQALVLAELLSRGLYVAIPVVDNGYDLVVIQGSQAVRIQVKSAGYNASTDRWHVRARRAGRDGPNVSYRTLTADDCDLLIIRAAEFFYVIPVEELRSDSIALYPHRHPSGPKASGFEQYKDGWDQLNV